MTDVTAEALPADKLKHVLEETKSGFKPLIVLLVFANAGRLMRYDAPLDFSTVGGRCDFDPNTAPNRHLVADTCATPTRCAEICQPRT
ncbi:hypothetical protein N2601_31355 (plasmid) [Rhizobium sp. CB3060]|uniref:hypothetical protein n=1 Tax=Rhizobium sp. CB3060 TaxID=3138255 RepID=UPI0021A72940|nr:hypothetical protein [Rhizobium tropici]UWU25481.1 hypothetical protein N2601_31355 [Rhizobium tropici]